jgi:acyl-CoA thioesterase-1
MRRLIGLAGLLVLSACSLRTLSCGVPAPDTQAPASTEAASSPDASGAASDPSTGRVVFLGDSLTAGLGVLSDEAYPSLLQKKFDAEGYHYEMLNAGLSGDTTAGALRRVDDLLGGDTKILVVALGGNDELRGLSLAQTHDNLSGIIDAAAAKGVPVMLAGMYAPTNLGPDYQTGFSAIFPRLAREHKDQVVFVPFLLEGVAGNPALNQPDGIHPNPQGAQVIADLLYPKLRTMVDSIGGGGGPS